MDDRLLFTPSGRIAAEETAAAEPNGTADAGVRKAMRAFASSQAEGLFALATLTPSGTHSSTLAFWRDFAAQYLTELCHTPESAERQIDPVEPPPRERLKETVSAVPPMRGAEYLSADGLETIWRDLDVWVRAQVEAGEGGLGGFLERRAPRWHQVGRVCFHLAENKRDPELPFAFLATYVPGRSAADRLRYQPLGKALEQYAGAQNRKTLVHLLAPIHRASEQSELIRSLVESGDIYHPLAWTPEEAYRFLTETPLYESSGVLVRLPDWWRKRPRPQVGVVIGQNKRSRLGADELLDFKVTLALGDETLTPAEWEALLTGEDGLVLLRGQWVEVDREKLAGALEHWKKVEQASQDGSLSFIEGMRLLAGAPADLHAGDVESADGVEWSFARAGRWLGEVLEQMRSPAGVDVGDGLSATLRPYQKTGVGWLSSMTGLGLGVCLADDMGLGKTIQVLALLLLVRKRDHKLDPKRDPGGRGKPGRGSEPSLLVLPASLLANWKAEMTRFTPSLRTVFVHPSETEKQAITRLAESPAKLLRDVDVVVTTYGMLHRQPWLVDVDWRLAILDEAQAIKNPSTRQTRTVKKLRARSRIALTGTPVENRLADLWSLFDFLCPGLLGSAKKFKQFVRAMDGGEQDRYKPLRNLVRPYILRRLKTDKSIIADLPDKSEVKAFCGLSKRQATLYRKSVEEMAVALRDQDGIKRRGLVLAYLMRFKQICNHPSQLLGDGEYPLADSGKFARLVELCSEIASRQEKALVFTQFREMTDPIHSVLAEVFGRSGLILHGGTPVRSRQKLVDQFQREEGPPFFVLSLKAGGTGLNLTAASQVIHFDRWWNPAVENQATDRAFRIGQHRNVLVHKFVCRGTVEEHIDRMIEDKQSLADDVLAAGAEKLLTELSDEQLIEVVSLDVDKAMI